MKEEKNMPNGDILAKTAPRSAQKPKLGKKKISVLGIILTIIVTIVVILLGERIIFDLNKAANPVVEKEYTTQQDGNYRKSPAYSGLTYDKARVVSQARVYYPREKEGEYKGYKLLIHASFIVPIFLLTFLLYYLFNVRLKSDNLMIVMWGYMFFALWMVVHLIGEAMYYVYKQFPQAGIYIVLVVLAAIFTGLAIFIQKKVAEHHKAA